MSLRIVSAARAPRMPWKNGGGSTTELAIGPPEATLADFDWRLSIAHVAADGPFSSFPGIDRTLVLIEGAGIDLIVDETHNRLRPGTPPLSFDGAATTAGALAAGPIRDFNVMSKRAICSHTVSIAAPRSTLVAAAPLWFLFAAFGPSQVRHGNRTRMLERFDLLAGEQEPGPVWVDAQAIWVTITTWHARA